MLHDHTCVVAGAAHSDGLDVMCFSSFDSLFDQPSPDAFLPVFGVDGKDFDVQYTLVMLFDEFFNPRQFVDEAEEFLE